MKENSIKNERSSIEENIEILEKFKNNEMQRDKLERDVRCGGWKIGDIYKCLELDNAIDNILSDYKRVLKENEELKFKERRRIIGKYGDAEIHDVINRTLSNDYISVQKVKDKIEKLNDVSNAEELEDIMIGGNYTITELVQYVLQELLNITE